VRIEDGVIVAVGAPGDVPPPARAPSTGAAARSSPARSRAQPLVPVAPPRLGDDLPFLEWRDRALYRYSPRLDADGVQVGALFAFGEMLLHGVTTVCDFFYLNDGANENASAVIAAAERLGIRVVLARCFYDWDGAPASYRESIPRAVQNFQSLHARHAGDARRMVTVQPAPHSLHGASREMIIAAAGCAATRARRSTSTSPRSRYQVEDCLARYRARPLHAVAAMGILDERLIAVHGCWFDETERRLLADKSASLIYNPNSNMFLATRDRRRRPAQPSASASLSAPTAAAPTAASRCSTRCAPARCCRR